MAPVRGHDRPLAALRYLVSKLDERQMGRAEGRKKEVAEKPVEERRTERQWQSVGNEALWRGVW